MYPLDNMLASYMYDTVISFVVRASLERKTCKCLVSYNCGIPFYASSLVGVNFKSSHVFLS